MPVLQAPACAAHEHAGDVDARGCQAQGHEPFGEEEGRQEARGANALTRAGVPRLTASPLDGDADAFARASAPHTSTTPSLHHVGGQPLLQTT